jgi:hypothetical protein
MCATYTQDTCTTLLVYNFFPNDAADFAWRYGFPFGITNMPISLR